MMKNVHIKTLYNYIVYICIVALIGGFFTPVSNYVKAIEKEYPKVIFIEADKHNVQPGDVINFTAKIDCKEQIKYFTIRFFNGVSYTGSIGFHQEEDGLFHADICIPSNFINATYTISEYYCCTIKDVLIRENVNLEYDDACFTVTGGSNDVTAPQINDMSISKRYVTIGDRIQIIADVEDETELDTLYIQFKNDKIETECYIFNKNEDGKYELDLYISDFFSNGEYTLSICYASDKCYNEIYYDCELFDNIFFVVSGGSNDKSPPLIKSVSINKKTVYYDEEVEITVNVYDDSRVKLFYVRFGSDDIVKNIKILKKISGKYVASFTIDDTWEYGVYHVVEYYISDEHYNKDYCYADSGNECVPFSNISFEVVQKMEAEPTPAASPSDAPKPTESLEPTPTVSPSDAPKPTESPEPTPTVSPSDAPKPTERPEPTPTTSSSDIIDSNKQKNKLKKGKIFTVNNIQYKVISVSGKRGRVALIKYKRKSGNIVVDKNISYRGYSFVIKEIGDKAFADCLKLKKITIAGSVESIGRKAFYHTPKLRYIYLKTKKLKHIGKKAFYGIYENAVIKVPRDKKMRYIKLLQGKYKA